MTNLTYLDDYASFEDMLAARESKAEKPEVKIVVRSINYAQDSIMTLIIDDKAAADRVCKHCTSVEPCLADRYINNAHNSYRVFANFNFVLDYLEKHFVVTYG